MQQSNKYETEKASKLKIMSTTALTARDVFAELNIVRLYFESDQFIAVSHYNDLQWTGRDVGPPRECLSIYQKSTCEFIAHQDALSYPVNDIDFHKTRPWILIGSGYYNGGFYEGKLQLWDFDSNTLFNIVPDINEVLECRFHGNGLTFLVGPPDHDHKTDLEQTRYVAPVVPDSPVSLDELEAVERTAYPDEVVPYHDLQEKCVKRLIEISDPHGRTYTKKHNAWDLMFLDGNTLVSALADMKLEVFNLETGNSNLVNLPGQGDCAQLFYNAAEQSIVVNTSNRQYNAEHLNQVFKLDLQTQSCRRLMSGDFVLTTFTGNSFLTRAANWQHQTEAATIYNADFEKVHEFNLGHYDLFNHYFRIDSSEEFLVLFSPRGTRSRRKKLLAIDPLTYKQRVVAAIDGFRRHHTRVCSLEVGNRIVIAATRSNMWANASSEVIFMLDHRGKTKWTIEPEAKVLNMCALECVPHTFVAGLSSGQVVVYDAASGHRLQELTGQSRIRAGVPLSLANWKNKLAIGYDNGQVELMTFAC